MKGSWRQLVHHLMDTFGVYNAPQNKLYIYVTDNTDPENPVFKVIMVIQKRKMGWFYWFDTGLEDMNDHTNEKQFVRTGKGDLRRILKTKLKNCVTQVKSDFNGQEVMVFPPKYS